MPTRKTLLVNNNFYHILNRGVGAIPIFNSKRDYQKLLDVISYYQNCNPPARYSQFISLPLELKSQMEKSLEKENDHLVKIICYCFMPNHFHLLLQQLKENGIFDFIRKGCNSYSHYFNLKYQRKGALFEDRFKAVMINTDEQLLHVSRYIHINPHSSHLIKNFEYLKQYPYSSLPEYLNLANTNICKKEIILDRFKSLKDYEVFLKDQLEYQRTLENIKHLALE